MTPEQKLAAIRALVAPLTHEQVASILAAEVREVLDAPSSPVPPTVDRDALHVVDVHIEALRDLARSPVGAAMTDRLDGALAALRDVRASLAREARP